MAVEKQMTPSNIEIDDSESVEVEIVNPDSVSVSGDDESMVIDFSGEMVEQIMGPEHDANLAEYMEDADLESLASELVTDFESDKQSRRDWARSYTRGLDLLGMKIEERTQPWQGAAGVFHPLLTEAVVRFQ
ncbi:MAG: hypothetical protein VX024_01455, partial [SAR324 cluster bacterium]|nr:hypothetical protein [SAR324 cluster bacterium]